MPVLLGLKPLIIFLRKQVCSLVYPFIHFAINQSIALFTFVNNKLPRSVVCLGGHFRTQTKKIRDLGETELAPGGEARDGMYCFDFLIFGNIFMVYFQILTCNFIFFWL